ncbi:MAG TPA: hypothetical protein VES38_04805 [Methylotenera sp.]|nr:hypothetical protein [Methylotenera sp.]
MIKKQELFGIKDGIYLIITILARVGWAKLCEAQQITNINVNVLMLYFILRSLFVGLHFIQLTRPGIS